MEFVDSSGNRLIKLRKSEYNSIIETLRSLQSELQSIRQQIEPLFDDKITFEIFHDHELVILLTQGFELKEAEHIIKNNWEKLTDRERQELSERLILN
jgi:predicted patatin/cPLA2 family phospholipase